MQDPAVTGRDWIAGVEYSGKGVKDCDCTGGAKFGRESARDDMARAEDPSCDKEIDLGTILREGWSLTPALTLGVE